MPTLHTLSAVEALDLFRSRDLSPVEYLEGLIARNDAVGGAVNAFTDTYFDEALHQARVAAQVYVSGEPRPLEGLPIAVKDEADVAGKRTTNGSLLWVDHVAQRDEPMIERIRAAGGIIHARTTTPEFSIAFWTWSKLWGITRNPWNLDFDVSGSSGGSGAALAAGLTPLATGSDIGGSIRAPASCCGVVGYKPAYGRIPQPAPFGLDSWSHLGPLARTVADTALFADQLIGPHPRDLASIRPALRIGDVDSDVRGMRIALSQDLGDWPVLPVIRKALTDTAASLRSVGAVVEEVPLCIERKLIATASDAHYGMLFAAASRQAIAGREGEANTYTRNWLATLETPPSPMQGLEAEGAIIERVNDILERFDVLLCPTASIPALRAGVDHTEVPVTIDGVDYDPMREIFLTEIFNATGRCPVINVPIGRDDLGVPIGAQVVARTFEDPTAFRVAAAMEATRPWPLVAEPTR
jgi:Asp-tRNA(Asn)/Glu-tRNA(Gln) amidotransferase A subunit family amidase